MENSEKTMSGADSLKIISEMISKTKVNIRQSSFHLLFWGWLIMIISLAEYFLENFSTWENPWLVWTLTIPGVVVSMVYGFVKGNRQSAHTYAEGIYMWTWLGFLVLVSSLILFLALEDLIQKVGPFILLVAAFAVFLSGIIIKFRPLILGGISIWVFSFIGFFAGPYIAPLAIPAAVLSGYLVPGYMLKNLRSANG